MSTYQKSVERNEKIVDEMKERAKKGFQYGEKALFIGEMAEKYGITIGNAQQLFYSKVRATEKNTEPELEAKIIRTISINSEEVRIVNYKESPYVVAKDILMSIGIKSTSSYLNDLLMEEDKIITPIPSSRGLAKTLIISIDTALVFLEIVSGQHQSVKIRASAKKGIPVLKNLQGMSLEEEEAPAIQQKVELKHYIMGETVQIQVLHIGEKLVDVETADEHKTRGTIYIADVADMYVRDLHDFFEEGEIIEATIKGYDERTRRLSLTTFENPYMKLRSKFKTSTQKAEWETSRIVDEMEEVSPVTPTETLAPAIAYSSEQEIAKIMDYLTNEVNLSFISPEARQKLAQLLQANSLFELSVEMVKLRETFKPDVSLLFIQQLESNLKK